MGRRSSTSRFRRRLSATVAAAEWGVPTQGRRSYNAGKFKAVLKILAPGPGAQADGTDTVSGTFGKHGEAKGTVTSHFFKGSSGETVDWTAVS